MFKANQSGLFAASEDHIPTVSFPSFPSSEPAGPPAGHGSPSLNRESQHAASDLVKPEQVRACRSHTVKQAMLWAVLTAWLQGKAANTYGHLGTVDSSGIHKSQHVHCYGIHRNTNINKHTPHTHDARGDPGALKNANLTQGLGLRCQRKLVSGLDWFM